MEFALPPGKTDQTGKLGLKKFCLVDALPDSVCCGMAVCDMLYHSPLSAGVFPADVPLFQDPRSGAEISYTYALQRFQTILVKCFPGLEPEMHSLRAGGGSSAYCVGGEGAASAMGHWRGDSKWRYFFTLRVQLESASLQMSRVDQGPVANLARGPLATARRAP